MVDHENEELKVFKQTIIDLFSFIGDGISEIEIDSHIKPFWYGSPYKKEWHNEAEITFHREPWDGIFLSKWKSAEEILEKIESDNAGIDYYVINPSQN